MAHPPLLPQAVAAMAPVRQVMAADVLPAVAIVAAVVAPPEAAVAAADAIKLSSFFGLLFDLKKR